MSDKFNKGCCDHGGKRTGCGRKPGVKTLPIRLPAWLLEQLSEQGDSRQLIIQACLACHPSIKHPSIEHSRMNKKDLDTND